MTPEERYKQPQYQTWDRARIAMDRYKRFQAAIDVLTEELGIIDAAFKRMEKPVEEFEFQEIRKHYGKLRTALMVMRSQAMKYRYGKVSFR